MVQVLAQETDGHQQGAIKNGGVEFPYLTAFLYGRLAQKGLQSYAVIYTDIKAAFYSAVNEVALGEVLGSSRREEFFGLCDLPLDARQRVRDIVEHENTAIKRWGVGHIWRKFYQDWHKSTACLVVGSEEVIQLDSGTRPGGPLADTTLP